MTAALTRRIFDGLSMDERSGILAWSKRTWAALGAALVVSGACVGSRWGVVRVSDGAHWSVFVGAMRLGVETYRDDAEALEMTPPAGVKVWSFTDDDDAAWPDTQSTHAWITSETTVPWLTRRTVSLLLPAAPAWGLVGWALVRERRLSRARSGACTACGYSLAGLEARAGGVVCPECGAARV